MTTKGFNHNFKPFEILTEEQVKVIRQGALDILESIGVRVEHQRARKLLEKNGCQVNYNETRARIPSDLVEEACARHLAASI